ncbi:hypothetical protein SAMN02800692_0172 [Luteibacter sp. UNC138MFCol5.1]|uniref:hypothetical protein n=1 Tax=Luteibacter sp. UNC138MFCol5.1 TaxID=1502774 RepID=UPI0008D38A01|nr:hypothetical protein [Luteibacter sp. UNC138MFCol5.1]SEO31225.1 hypothetical protein SAMN02800692_0172 [Luteibacter sp. UNC138MFCol5.1]
MTIGYFLMHTHRITDTNVDVKMLGLYRSEKDALDAIPRYLDRAGFSSAPDGFFVDRHVVGERRFASGFIHGQPVEPDGDVVTDSPGSVLGSEGFLLIHDYEMPEEVDNERLVGLFATKADREKAKAQALILPGFSSFPDAFSGVTMEVGKDYWEEGYVTLTPEEM